ncbi:acyl-CoA dehydratase activase-related protein [Clostridium mediterraneense]|uniref:acyl-CoA dehydratase activase-related protein n=1 Tax=Clostridium mediterraneense TaxID=1805472 RepID=UPI000A0315B4|nr:acyl-CoA dehydratase activase-related protein [Clostridium mediterraneense]
MEFKIGIDAGSTTVKLLVLNENNDIVYKSYRRHYSKIREVILEEFENIKDIVSDNKISLAITGSAGYGISKETDIIFVQEVFASTLGIKRTIKDVDVAIELGGEDAKIIFLSDGFEERMNSSCAGGTGAFIDQMAHLMNITNQELDDLSLEHTMIYPIASRCGVFAKSDVQPLLNQGAKKSDISASIFQSVVDQTVGGLAQGREIKGKVLFLGGPLYFYKGLRERFRKTLKLDETTGILPENAEVFVALGAAIYSQEDKKRYTFNEIVDLISDKSRLIKNTHVLPSLFESEEDYEKFKERHARAKVEFKDINEYEGDVYLGIDAGSTTTKVVLINDQKDIIYTYYSSNKGNPVKVIEDQLKVIYDLCGDNKKIKSSTVTGYGEELIKSAFGIDFGIVETMAHFKAGKHFNPKVDFILDIGGQDIKCFNIKNGIINNIMLNEACSSGCGSFIESFAGQMGYDVKDFAKMALFAKNVVDLGSKCTVFMNSSVKQAQKDGASIEDISAGLSISVVKNALYKVIRIKDAKELGENVLVQGGTMYNDAILRSFEMELGRDVVRPNISGLMGAYGAALYAMERAKDESSIISREKLESFTHTSRTVRCGLCGNKCNMTVNIFQDNKRFLSGNRCKKPEGKKHIDEVMSIYDYKYKKIRKLQGNEGSRGKIGIPLVLNMYEMLPFWYSFFESLGIEVVLTDASSRKLYRKGQHTIPSDTVCYPAKISHGHIENLLEKGVQTIFYPCMSYNVEEKLADNCYNCPVVAYYPELLKANIKALNNPDIKFMMPYLTVNNSKVLAKALLSEFKDMFGGISKKEIKVALEKAYKDYDEYREDIKNEGRKYIQHAREQGKKIIVLAGRPYHIDPEINHGIDRAMCELGTVVISEDCIASMDNRPDLNILNQWTYQARLYSAADAIGNEDDMYLIQLVSFGCGTDAITTDEVRDIIERKNKIYTQIKIDETSNLGAAKIRIRSLLETLDTDKGGVK